MEVYASQPSHYRMRAEFRIWHEGDDLYYAMFDPADPRTPIRTDQFLAASHLINELMPKLIDAVRDTPILRHKLFQVDFLTTTTGEALISLLYHKRLMMSGMPPHSSLMTRFRLAILLVVVVRKSKFDP